GDLVVAGRKFQLERPTLHRDGTERVIEYSNESTHPLMHVASNRQRNLGVSELCLIDHSLNRLSDVELWILFGPRMDVVECHVAVFNGERLIRHHGEDVWDVMAIFLVDFYRRSRCLESHARWQA